MGTIKPGWVTKLVRFVLSVEERVTSESISESIILQQL
jgi:hypothetical protein